GTDIIEHFSLAYDGETVTLIWHVRRVNNTRLVITSSASLANASDASAYTAPEPLRLPDDTVVQWLTPTNSPESNLPVAVHDGRTLSFAQMTDGQLTNVEALVETGSLIGAPAIASSPRTVTLSWAQPSGLGYANLYAIEREH
ncbi:MAG: hypothetical protein AAFQ52_19725, partial [Chloroflexota bacterium]